MTVALPMDGSRPAGRRRDLAGATAAVRDLLRAKVLNGYYDSRPLPDEAALQLLHSASRGAVRAALALLKDEGLIERYQGSGTFVVAQKATNRFDELSGLRGRGPVIHEVLNREVLGAPDIVADLLELQVGIPVLRLDRRTVAAGEPVGVWTNYLPLALGGPLADPASDLSGEYYRALESLCGLELGHADVCVEAVVADAVVAARLDIPVGSALMRLERVVHLADGRPVDFGVGRLRGDRLRMSGTQVRRPGGDIPLS
jgi:GntR family transcriptional regulator